jgi:mRNA-degrading endonuclease RelE of RelBE toxin-antitoxin system
VEFAQSVQAHLRALEARERAVVLSAIEHQLPYQPLVETRHRKPLRPNPIAPWQLSVEDLRVFYEVSAEANGPVRILAVGRKRGSILAIGGKEVQL